MHAAESSRQAAKLVFLQQDLDAPSLFNFLPGSPLALIEEVVGNLPDLVGLGCRHPEPVVDHQVRKLVAVDENDLLALDSFHEVHGVLREVEVVRMTPFLARM